MIEDKERTCDSLLMCIVTVLSHGLRSGGGVGDVLRKPSKEVREAGRQRQGEDDTEREGGMEEGGGFKKKSAWKLKLKSK